MASNGQAPWPHLLLDRQMQHGLALVEGGSGGHASTIDQQLQKACPSVLVSQMCAHMSLQVVRGPSAAGREEDWAARADMHMHRPCARTGSSALKSLSMPSS